MLRVQGIVDAGDDGTIDLGLEEGVPGENGDA